MESKTFISGFLMGAATGVAIGLLLSNVDAETKQKIIEGAKKIAGSLSSSAGSVEKDEGIESRQSKRKGDQNRPERARADS
jgi:hypothetical protein